MPESTITSALLGAAFALTLVSGWRIAVSRGPLSAVAIVVLRILMLGLIAGIAALVNILSTAITGVAIPLLIKKFKSDPALASPIIVTALTDALGYLIYLGLASAAITWLV